MNQVSSKGGPRVIRRKMDAPLLTAADGDLGLIDGDGDYRPAKGFKEVKSVFWIETAKLWRITGPIVVTILCQYGTFSVTNIFAGHIGDVELSAVSISLSVINTFSFGFMLGMGSALETLCGQAFGAGKVYMLGVYMQRSWIILSITCIVLLPIYIFATPILKLLGQQDDIANLSGEFTLLLIPQLFSLAINFPTQKFLQAQSKVKVLAWTGLVTLVVHIGLLWLLIYAFGWGTTGAAIAFDISSWGAAVAQVFYVVGWCKDGWHGLSWAAFKDIWAFVRLSLASAVMLCLEVWYMMSIIILAGHLDNAVIAVGSLSICMNINGYELMLFVGINAAISVRVANELGFRHPRAAKYAVYVAVFQSFLIGIFFMVLILATRNYFEIIFTSSKDMQQAVANLAYLLGFTMVLNSVQPVISGVAVGGGWQALVAYINLGCYYIFGLPLGYFLGYVMELGVKGLWDGMIAGTALQTLILCFVLYKTNWNKEVEQTTDRMRKWGGQDANTQENNI
ncbi:Protein DETOXIFICATION like [Actinidia chinensis var. chinensis]|uniref:Protein DETOXIFICATION n=1 Tax=Actinidia chinensis var. chinensis TaxID=1590841 RepID=A0A2R6RW99_ACTCC|nr:Protein DETOXIFICATION like [Actinidia chinensis var. chinensis]